MASVLIAGATRGIGYALAEVYVRRGDRVFATARSEAGEAALQSLASEYGALHVERLDLEDPASISALGDAMAERPIDVVICNGAASGVRRPTHSDEVDYNAILDDIDYALFEQALRINLFGPMRLFKALLPALVAGSEKKFVAISSRLGSISMNTIGNMYPYKASKAAMNQVLRGLSLDLKQHSDPAYRAISIAMVHPGWVLTRMAGERTSRQMPDGSTAHPLDPQTSANGIVTVIDSLRPEDSGRFCDWQNNTMAW